MATDAAPAELDKVVRFLNTRDIEGDEDEFSAPETVRSWLVTEQLIDPGDFVTKADVATVTEFREALRDLALSNHGRRVDQRALEVLNRATETVSLGIRFAGDRPQLVSHGSGVTSALAQLAAIVFTATADGTFSRLKVCLRDSCRWAYFDRSRNRSRSWCSMAVCGNRNKAAVYRERHAEN